LPATNAETAVLIHSFRCQAKACLKLNEDFIGESVSHSGRKSDDGGLKQFDEVINDYATSIYELIRFR